MQFEGYLQNVYSDPIYAIIHAIRNLECSVMIPRNKGTIPFDRNTLLPQFLLRVICACPLESLELAAEPNVSSLSPFLYAI